MKKVLSLVLVLSMVLGSFGMAFAATPSDVVGEECETAVAVLMDLGVVEGYKDGSYQPEGIVTRAEMATLIVKALGLNGSATGTSTFTDMGNAKWAEGYVAYASSLGVVSGYGDGTFRPNNTVTYDQATTMIIQALGYTTDCLNGTYPGAFVSKAKTLGILDDVSGTGAEGANRGDVAIMLYNALDQAIGKVNKDGDWVAQAISFDNKGNADEYDTMLSRLDAEVMDPSEHNLVLVPEEDEEAFILDETWAEDAVVNVYPYVGHVVSAYINDDDEIIGIKEVFGTALTGDFNSQGDEFEATIGDFDIDVASKATIGALFYNGESTNKIKLTQNGEELTESSTVEDLVKADDTAFTLICDVSGQKIKDIYAVHVWEVSENAIVDEDDIADIFDNSKLLGVDLPENDDNELDLNAVEFVGVNSYEDIKAGDVVYVYESETDDEATRIAVGGQTVSGIVTRLEDGTYMGSTLIDEIRVNGTDYCFTMLELGNNGLLDLTDGYSSSDIAEGKIEADDEIVMTLDAYGYIYDFELDADGADDYAIVLEYEDEDTTKISSGAKIKLLLADGSVAVYDIDDDDDNNFVGENALYNASKWTEKITQGAIVKYGLNSSQEIDSLEGTGYDGDDEDLDQEVTGATTLEMTCDDVTAKGYWNGLKIAKDASIFVFGDFDENHKPGDLTDDDEYEVMSYESLCGSDDVIAMRYIVEDNEIVAMLLVDDFTSGNEVWALFDSKALNSSDAGAEFDLWVDGKVVTYDADEDLKPAWDELLYKVEFDTDGAVSDMIIFAEEAAGDEDYTYATTGAIVSDHVELDGDTFKTTTDAAFFGYCNATSTKTTASALTLDSDVLIYLMNDEGDWEKAGKSDLRNLADGDYVYFYDTEDADKVFDIVVIVDAENMKN